MSPASNDYKIIPRHIGYFHHHILPKREQKTFGICHKLNKTSRQIEFHS